MINKEWYEELFTHICDSNGKLAEKHLVLRHLCAKGGIYIIKDVPSSITDKQYEELVEKTTMEHPQAFGFVSRASFGYSREWYEAQLLTWTEAVEQIQQNSIWRFREDDFEE